MHKLIDFICDELEEFERKAEKDGKLSMAEIQYVDTLAHAKKNLMKTERMSEEDEYSMAGGMYHNGSYARDRMGRYSNVRGGRRGGANQYGSYAMEGYSRGSEGMVEDLRMLMNEAPDDRTRMEFERFIRKIEQM